MKIKRSLVERIVAEEFARRLKELAEAGKEDDDKKKKPGTVSAEEENNAGPPTKDSGNMAPKKGSAKKPETPGDSEHPEEDEIDEPKANIPPSPEDDELTQDVAGDDEPEEINNKKGIGSELVGKHIQSMTFEKKSKAASGAQEIVIQFEEVPEPLRIVIGKSGVVKYVWKGEIHNTL